MDAVTAALHNASPAQRLRLLDGAAAELRAMDPRPCGRSATERACPADCGPCISVMARAIVRLAREAA